MKNELARQILEETPIDMRKVISEHWHDFILKSSSMKLNIEQLKNILSSVNVLQHTNNGGIRFGQAIWITLYRKHSEITEKYWSTAYDPYQTDAIVISLFELILDNEAAEYWYSTDEFKSLVDKVNYDKH